VRLILLFACAIVVSAVPIARAETPGRVIYTDPAPRSWGTTVYSDIGPLNRAARAADSGVPPVPDPLAGFHYGLGVGINSDLGGIGAVKKETGTNIVRISRENPAAARGLFEVHYYIPTKSLGLTQSWPGFYTAVGPYMSLNTAPLGESKTAGQLFDSVGLGIMYGIQGGGCNKTVDDALVCTNELHSFNVGIGAIIDTDVKRLRTGIVENQPTTQPESELLTRATRIGLQVIFSYKLFSFNLK
jgi:hypothetical protein